MGPPVGTGSLYGTVYLVYGPLAGDVQLGVDSHAELWGEEDNDDLGEVPKCPGDGDGDDDRWWGRRKPTG